MKDVKEWWWKVVGLIMIALTIWAFWYQVSQAEERSIIINELMWMGSSASSSDEWIELKNLTGGDIDVSGWEMTRLSSGAEKSMTVFSDQTLIGANGFMVVGKYDLDHVFSSGVGPIFNMEPEVVVSGVVLSNSALEIKLYQGLATDGVLVDIAGDGGSPLSGEYSSGELWRSMERNLEVEDGAVEESWHSARESQNLRDGVADISSPGAENSVTNQAPEVDLGPDKSGTVGEEIVFEGVKVEDSEGGELEYKWSFGDGSESSEINPSHIFGTAGEFTVELVVSDNEGLEGSDTVKVKIGDRSYSDEIKISEVFPNPEGSDEGEGGESGEFIELKNNGNNEIDLKGWSIDDEEGGSSPYIIGDKIVKSGEYVVIYRNESGISLNNTEDKARLIDPSGEVKDEVSYSGVKEDQSWSRQLDGLFAWTSEVTPRAENSFSSDENSDNQDKSNSEDDQNKEDEYEKVSITEVYSKSKNDLVRVVGVISVAPGVLSDQYFYIQDESRGIKIYFSKKEWPSLKMGDEIEVKGKVSESYDQKKINISSKDDIKVVSSGKKVVPKPLKINEIGDAEVGLLIRVAGKIAKQSGDTFYIDDGTGELKVSILKNTGVDKPKMKKGDQVAIIGVIDLTSSGKRLLVREDGDIIPGGELLGSELPHAGGGRDTFVWLFALMAFIIMGLRLREFVVENYGRNKKT